MFDRASKKLGLEQAVLGTFGQDEDDDKPTNKEMEQLLKKGAYALLADDNDEIVKQFCADDIDTILAKRTRTRVVEGAKTATWLNKQGMNVTKSKFSADSKSVGLDMDDPLFWQKVMPDFITPNLMIRQLEDLSNEICGTTKKKGPGRGRGRWKKKDKEEENDVKESAEDSANTTENSNSDAALDTVKEDAAEEKSKEDEDDSNSNSETVKKNDEEDEGGGDDIDDNDDEEEKKFHITKTQKRKIAKFMSDLKSLMEGLLDEAEDDSLSSEDKASGLKLLLTITMNEKMFNDDQRRFAKTTLKRLEGNRRRRCRTSEPGGNQNQRSSPMKQTSRDDDPFEIREELRIVSSKKIKKRRRKGGEDEPHESKRRKNDSLDIGDDGYKIHSDDEADWSDVGEDIYGQSTKKKATISRKESRRRRQWAADGDAAVAAGRPWPALPRTEVSKVLRSLLEEVLKHDLAKGGIFSEPVPRDDFPEYYDQVKTPMDYGTMKKKLDNGEYRSGQAMQKDFRLVMQNCLQFNAHESDICQEARQQALMMPTQLREAAIKNDLFLAEDGSVLHIVDEKNGKDKDDSNTSASAKKRKKRKRDDSKDGDTTGKKKGKKRLKDEEAIDLGVEEDDVPLTTMKKKKPRIKINLREIMQAEEDEEKKVTADDNLDKEKTPATKTPASRKKKGRKASAKIEENGDEVKVPVPVPSKRARNAAKKDTPQRKAPASRGRSYDEDYLNVALLKTERENLGGDSSYAAARKLFISKGAWVLPSPITPDKFRDVALATFKQMEKIDRYGVFAEPVSDSDAPDYSDIVKNPIDLATMKTKLNNGEYGEGTKGASKLYADFLLMLDNCRLYNDDDGEVTEEAARIMALLPEIYGGSCSSALKKQKK
jgi:hypothetical protein